jgi:formate hydrogenlyase transcriptional activator
VPADPNILKYRALLETSEAFVACRDYDTLVRTLWVSLRPVIPFDYLAFIRYDQGKHSGWLEAIAGNDDLGVPLRTELPLEGTPIEILLATGETLYIPDLRAETRFRPDLMERYERFGILSGYWVLLTRGGKTLGSLSFSSQAVDAYGPEDRELMDHIARQVTIAVENALAFEEIRELRRKIEDEKVYLEEEIRAEYRFDEIVGSSAAIREVLKQIETAAPTDSTVLIQGETGTGKELVARAIHQLSGRKNGTFIKLNCSAIPAALLESELLGHEKGAFTGALAPRIGRFELANGGTLFMDEIAELPLELQPKLLRVLQDGRFERLGGSRTIQSDFRLVAATNQDLRAMVNEQRFRADLYYRINVFPITIPPLRERREDIPTLVRYFVQEFSTRMRKPIESIPAEAMTALVNYSWPGNIRELRNVLERSVIVTQGKRLRIPKDALDESAQTPDGGVLQMAEAERRHIIEALNASKWIVGGPKGAAAMLGLKRSTLQSRMEKLGIRVQRQIGATSHRTGADI